MFDPAMVLVASHLLCGPAREQGHDVKLIPVQFVWPFVKSNKNDFLDAEAIAETVSRQNMSFVPIKTHDQLDLQPSTASAVVSLHDELPYCELSC
jgi:transposase